MAVYDSRLFNVKALRQMAEIADDAQNELNEFTDLLAEYEQVDDDYPDAERGDAREDIRGKAWTLLGEVLANYDRLRDIRERLGTGDEEVLAFDGDQAR